MPYDVPDSETGWYLPVDAPITSLFGSPFGMDSGYTHQGRAYKNFNKGVDFGARAGARVRAIISGTVVQVGDTGEGWGPVVRIKDKDGFIHNYGHLGRINVKVGQVVSQGAEIGEVSGGISGTSSGPHLSYDVFQDSPNGREFVDPTPWLARGNPKAKSAVDPAIQHDPSRSPRPSGFADASGGGMATKSDMVNLIKNEFIKAAKEAGWSDQEAIAFAKTGVSIANSESRLDPNATGDNGMAWGLFQNHLEGRGKGKTSDWLLDPINNIRLAIPELMQHFQTNGGLSAFNADPLKFTINLSRTAQRPLEAALRDPNQIKAFETGLSYFNDPTMLAEDTVAVGGMGPRQPGPGTPGLRAPTYAAATNKDAAGAIRDKIAAIAGRGDPDELWMLPGLTQALEALNALDPNAPVSPDVKAKLAQDKILSDREYEEGTRRFNAELEQRQREFGTTSAQRDRELGQGDRQIDESIRQFDLSYAQSDRQFAARLGYDYDKLDQEERQFIRNLNEQTRQFDSTLGEDRRQFDVTTGLTREQLAQDESQFVRQEQRLGSEFERTAGQTERRDAVSGMVDIVSQLVAAGAIDQRNADSALQAMLATWNPVQNDYLAGHEPGGFQSMLAKDLGFDFDPEKSRRRAFPLDLQAIYESKSKGFDLSQAWETARGLMAGMGATPPPSGTPAAGGATTAPQPGQGVQGPIIQPELPDPNAPPAAPPAPETPPGTDPIMQRLNQQAPPPGQPPAAPAAPEVPGAPSDDIQCPPGYTKAWDGQAWSCVPAGG